MTAVRKTKLNTDEIHQVRELLSELLTEIDLLAKASDGKPGSLKVYPDPKLLSPIERRLLVRSVFSFIEAVVFRLKVVALISERVGELSSGEIALAKEEDYDLDESGEVKTRPARLKFLSNLRFAFAVVAKVGGLDYRLDVSGAGWQSLQKALLVRDRLTHPKVAADLIVSDDEVRWTMQAFEWVFRESGILVAKALSANVQRQRQNPPKD